MDRAIMHIDMNAFFASVEQKCNPELRGKPIAVIGSPGRTVVTTCSYEARAFGVKTGMNKYEAKSVCPQLILVVGDNRKYTDTSIRMLKIFKRFAPVVEVYSVDEAFMDVSGMGLLYGDGGSGPVEIARKIKGAIKSEIGITCSAGIAPNKLLAKLASGMEKPDGLVYIKASEVSDVMMDLPVSELCGIGRKLTASLALLGVATCGELAAFPVGVLRRRFGIVGERLSLMARGIDSSPVVSVDKEAPAKTVGHSMTLRRDISDRVVIERYILKLSEMVARRARKYGLKGARVSLTLRYSDFRTFSRQRAIAMETNDARVISHTASSILDGIRLADSIRLIGVSIGRLISETGQVELFEAERKRRRLLMAMDAVNDRFGNFTVIWGELAAEREGSAVISPSWRPAGVKRVDVS